MSDRTSGVTRQPAARWIAPDVGGGVGLTAPGLMTANKLEALQQRAYDEAFARGLEEGNQAGRDTLSGYVEQLDALVNYLGEPFRQLDDDVESALVDLAIRVARQIIRRELKVDPSHVVGVVREAIKVLPISSRTVTVHLHPEDAAVVRAAYGESSAELAWNLVEDPVVSRGGLRVTTETLQVDARVEHRLDSILATLVGGEREEDG